MGLDSMGQLEQILPENLLLNEILTEIEILFEKLLE
jgi:hypothetical protein